MIDHSFVFEAPVRGEGRDIYKDKAIGRWLDRYGWRKGENVCVQCASHAEV